MGWVKRNKKWFAPYVRDLADLCGLKDWSIEVKDDWPLGVSDTAIMAIWRSNAYGKADLHVNTSQAAEQLDTPESVRESVVHEMLHLHTRDWDMAHEPLEEQVMPAVWSVVSARLDHEREQAVDAIAVAWSASLPLPKMSKGT